MNVENARHKFKNALFAFGLAMEVIQTLTKQDTHATILQAQRDQRETWKNLRTAALALIDAKMEELGR